MRTDSQLRSEFRSALEAVTPPAPWLVHAVKKGLGTKAPTRRSYRAPLQLRFGLNVIAILVLIGVALAAVGVYVTTHQSVTPAAHPGVGRVFFPTKMVSASTGWSWVDSTELWRTTDGGAHWTNVSPPSLPGRLSPYTDSAYLLDATNAWVAESSPGAAGGVPYVTTFRTIDGGKTWHEGASIGGQSPKLFFIDQNHGWLLLPTQGTLASLYSTDDAGLHWNFTSSAPWTVRPTSGVPSTITFTSLTTGWISGGNLMVTHDGGVTWHVQPLPVTVSTESYVSWPTFFDPQHGIAFFDPQPAGCSSGCSSAVLDPVRLLVTSDGGSTWVARSLPGEAPLQWFGDFVDADHGWLIAGTAADFFAVHGAPLPLYRTDDGGLTWVRLPTNVLWRSPEDRVGIIDILDFVDQNNGFAVRQRNGVANGYTQWLKTTDGGRTWTVVVEAPQTP
jgi:photosystem II stability/assembly factor-like uncharacterized protein